MLGSPEKRRRSEIVVDQLAQVLGILAHEGPGSGASGAGPDPAADRALDRLAGLGGQLGGLAHQLGRALLLGPVVELARQRLEPLGDPVQVGRAFHGHAG